MSDLTVVVFDDFKECFDKMHDFLDKPPCQFHTRLTRDELHSLFFYISRLRDSVLKQWEEREFSEEAMKKAQEELERDLEEGYYDED